MTFDPTGLSLVSHHHHHMCIDVLSQFVVAVVFVTSVSLSTSLCHTWDVTDSKSASESDRMRHFSGNPKSVGYLKSDRNGFKIFVSVQLYNYFRK